MKLSLDLFVLASIMCISAATSTCYENSASSNARAISNEARSHIGSTDWSKAGPRKTGRNTNKCNIFVAEVIENAGASVPHRRWWKWTPIGAWEWANPSSSYLTEDSCWSLVSGCARRGDVAAFGGHVGIVTGNGKTTSANAQNIGEKGWGFGSNDNPTLWRYTC